MTADLYSRIATLEKALEDARASSMAKSQFLANMSHEIRTPMNAILGMTELLLHAGLQGEYMGYLRNIHHASGSLLTIIDDILDFSKISAGKLETVNVPYDFGSLLSDISGVIGMRAVEKGLDFVIEADPAIPSVMVGDPGRIKQILINLLGNAVKYTRRGFVRLRVGARQVEGDWRLEWSVADSGIGIKDKDMGRVFELFEQLDTRANREVVGTGLGLAIARQLIEMMDGSIRVHSVYGQGTEFTFHIMQQSEGAGPLAKVGRPETVRVLFVTPSRPWTEAFTVLAERLGVRATCVNEIGNLAKVLKSQAYTDLIYDYAFAHEAVEALLLPPDSVRVTVLRSLGAVAGACNAKGQTAVFGPLLPMSLAQILNGDADSLLVANPDAGGSIGAFQLPGVRILVVDDNSVNLTVASQLLAGYGLTVDVAENGLEALTKVRTVTYDLVFMDHMMPILDGVDTAKAIRGFGERYRRLPIVALTANAISGMQEEFIAAGMNDFLSKPIEIRRLNAILRKWIPSWKIEEKATPSDSQGAANWHLHKMVMRLRQVDGLDLENGVARVGGSYESFLRVLRTFAASTQTVPARLEAHFSEKAIEALHMDFHSLKSGLASAGCYDLSAEARKLEFAAHDKRSDVIGECLPRFISRLRTLTESVANALESQQSAAPLPQGDASELHLQIPPILAAIEMLEHEKAASLMKTLASCSYGRIHDDLIRNARTLLDAFDYDQTTALLKKLL